MRVRRENRDPFFVVNFVVRHEKVMDGEFRLAQTPFQFEQLLWSDRCVNDLYDNIVGGFVRSCFRRISGPATARSQ